MPSKQSRFLTSFFALALSAQTPGPPPGAALPNVLYGAAYYNEYMPAALQPGQLVKDVALMTGQCPTNMR